MRSSPSTVSLIQQTIDTLNGVANSKSATWATIGPVVLLAIIGILLLSQINNMAAAIAGGVPIFAPRIGAVLATATGYRLGAAANRARLAFRNPLNPVSMSRREELASRQRARVGLRAASWAQSAEFRRLADQLRNPASRRRRVAEDGHDRDDSPRSRHRSIHATTRMA